MIHRNYMRRGVSLEVIVEEDDNSEVSLDPVIPFDEETDSGPSSPISSLECPPAEDDDDDISDASTLPKSDALSEAQDPKNLKQEKEKRKRQKEEERWKWERQRSLSCETLTILDVGDDEFSRERWEEEARDWNGGEPIISGSSVEPSISRKKILAARSSSSTSSSDEENRYEEEEHPEREGEPENEGEGYPERVEALDTHSRNPEEDFDRGKDHPTTTTDDDTGDGGSESTDATLPPPTPKPSPGSWRPKDPFDNDDNEWITVGELENVADGGTVVGQLNATQDDLDDASKLCKPKEVRFSDQLEFVVDSAPESTNEDVSLDSLEVGGNSTTREVETPRESPRQPELDTLPNHNQEILEDNLLTVESGRNLFETRRSTPTTTSLIHERLLTALEPPRVMIVEKPEVNAEENDASTLNNQEPEDREELSKPCLPPCSHAPHSTQLRPEELPPRHTVASVRQLFEKILPVVQPQDVDNTYDRNLARFEHVRSNPSSKILRFDRSDQKAVTTPFRGPQDRLLNPLDSTGKSIKSEILDNQEEGLDSHETPKSKSSVRFSVQNDEGEAEEVPGPQAREGRRQGVQLRKPKVANGFDVRKALRENPRYFHIRVKENKASKGNSKPHSDIKDAKRGANSTSGGISRRNTITYSYLEAKQQHSTGSTTSLRWTKETIDHRFERSDDSESQSSETSEDSGVSRDFCSSIISSFSSSTSSSSSSERRKPKWNDPRVIAREYASDPSFKWIDPSVLAKIRSRGTTVIYFGPRRHKPTRERSPLKQDFPRQSGHHDPHSSLFKIHSNELPRGDTSDPHDPIADVPDEHESRDNGLKRKDTCPKIVGMTPKKKPDSEGDSAETPGGSYPTRLKPFPHRDSRILHIQELKKKATGNNSVIYDFTHPKQQII